MTDKTSSWGHCAQEMEQLTSIDHKFDVLRSQFNLNKPIYNTKILLLTSLTRFSMRRSFISMWHSRLSVTDTQAYMSLSNNMQINLFEIWKLLWTLLIKFLNIRQFTNRCREATTMSAPHYFFPLLNVVRVAYFGDV